jgi:hypothetical protein
MATWPGPGTISEALVTTGRGVGVTASRLNSLLLAQAELDRLDPQVCRQRLILPNLTDHRVGWSALEEELEDRLGRGWRRNLSLGRFDSCAALSPLSTGVIETTTVVRPNGWAELGWRAARDRADAASVASHDIEAARADKRDSLAVRRPGWEHAARQSTQSGAVRTDDVQHVHQLGRLRKVALDERKPLPTRRPNSVMTRAQRLAIPSARAHDDERAVASEN